MQLIKKKSERLSFNKNLPFTQKSILRNVVKRR